jgi:hypothetical protein
MNSAFLCGSFCRPACGLSGIVAAVAALYATALVAAPPAARPRVSPKEVASIREVLEANFQACNHENVEALLATMSKSMPGVPEFAKEARDTFDQTDAYFRLADFELVEFRPPYAVARVIQITLPRDEQDRTTGTPQQIFYRGRSGLLPPWECVEYLQRFKKEGGKWKVDLIMTKPRPAEWPPK